MKVDISSTRWMIVRLNPSSKENNLYGIFIILN
jgi:hypothetical protein